MIFLIPFGLLVEGKIGWWKFLLLYFGIGMSECAIEQPLMLGFSLTPEQIEYLEYAGRSAIPGSVGASSAIFGLVVVTMLWHPRMI